MRTTAPLEITLPPESENGVEALLYLERCDEMTPIAVWPGWHLTVCSWGSRVEVHDLPPGVHVVCPDWDKTAAGCKFPLVISTAPCWLAHQMEKWPAGKVNLYIQACCDAVPTAGSA